MWHLIKTFITAFLSIFGSLITIIIFVKSIWPFFDSNVKIAICFLGFFVIFYFLENFYLKAVWGKNKLYGEVLTLLSDGYSEIHELYRKEHTIEEAINPIRNLCDNVAKSFSIITGSNCSISIKILAWDIDGGEKKLKADTLCRDRQSRKNRSYDTSITINWLHENTDFLHLFLKYGQPSGKYYFKNKLPWENNYQNTSFKLYGLPYNGVKIPILKHFFQYWRWPLPYKSTIVVPIYPKNEICFTKIGSSELVGFLCVDSPKMFAFKKNYDVDLLCGVADGIYNIIYELSQKK